MIKRKINFELYESLIIIKKYSKKIILVKENGIYNVLDSDLIKKLQSDLNYPIRINMIGVNKSKVVSIIKQLKDRETKIYYKLKYKNFDNEKHKAIVWDIILVKNQNYLYKENIVQKIKTKKK